MWKNYVYENASFVWCKEKPKFAIWQSPFRNSNSQQTHSLNDMSFSIVENNKGKATFNLANLYNVLIFLQVTGVVFCLSLATDIGKLTGYNLIWRQ